MATEGDGQRPRPCLFLNSVELPGTGAAVEPTVPFCLGPERGV
jgi:hypothetical protein